MEPQIMEMENRNPQQESLFNAIMSEFVGLVERDKLYEIATRVRQYIVGVDDWRDRMIYHYQEELIKMVKINVPVYILNQSPSPDDAKQI